MYKFTFVLTLCFFAFIVWIIFLADTGQNTIVFQLVRGIPYGDKMGHFFIFGLLSLGCNIIFKFKLIKLSINDHFTITLYLGSLTVFIFALLEELSQHFLTSRSFELSDLAADFLGVVCFSLVSFILAHRKIFSF